jgi:hypothetical protein
MILRRPLGYGGHVINCGFLKQLAPDRGKLQRSEIRDDSEEDGWVITAFVLAEEDLRLERKEKEGPWQQVAE